MASSPGESRKGREAVTRQSVSLPQCYQKLYALYAEMWICQYRER